MNEIGSCGWPSMGSDAHVKTEFPLDEELFHVEKQTQNDDRTTFVKPKAVPTATSDAAAASLQTAFCRRPSSTKAHETVNFNTNDVKIEANEEIYNGFGTTSFDSSNTALTCENGSNQCQNGNACVDAQQMDIYRDLILRHLIQDISTTCAKLGLPTDAHNWTQEHGSRWISEMCQQFNLTSPRQTYISGRVLLSMSQKDFVALAPEGGDTLYAQLQLWKTAFESYHQQQNGSQNSGGITAADNSMPKNNWTMNTNGQTMVVEQPMKDASTLRADFVQQQYIANDIHQQQPHYFNNVGIGGGVQDSRGFFGSGILPSPSGSDRSSNASMHDLGDEECIDLQSMLQMQQDGVRFCGPMTNMNMTNVSQTPSTDEARPSPFPRHSGTVHLWHFIRELLDHPNKQYGSCVRWVDRDEGTFKIESSHHLARFWGQRKNRAQMNYDKLSRSLRQYYKKGIIQKPEKKQRLVYKFLPPYNL